MFLGTFIVPLNFNARTPETMLILDMEEFELIKINSTEKNQMAFAVILKYFQANGRYPTKKDTIKPLILKSLASQLMTNSTLFQPIHLENRTAKRFRQKIRDFLGYRMATLSDANALIVWLIGFVA